MSDRIDFLTTIGRLRQRLQRTATWTAVCKTAALWLALFAAALLLDWGMELPVAARVALLILEASLLGFLIWLWIRPARKRRSLDQVALGIEHARPRLDGRLIAATQLMATPGVEKDRLAASMVERTVAEAEQILGRDELRDLVPRKPFQRAAIFLGAVGIICAVLAARWPETTGILLRRAALQSVAIPKKTRVIMVTGDRKVGRGDSLKVEARAGGLVPDQGTLIIYFTNRSERLRLDRQDKLFGRELFNLQESFQYRVRLNDAIGPLHTVMVLARPQVVQVHCLQEFPAYTGLRPLPRLPSDLTLLAGSQLRLRVQVNKPMAKATLRQIGSDLRTPLQPMANTNEWWAGSLAIPKEGLSGFSVELVDREGMESRDPVAYPIEILPDLAPVIRVTSPERKEELLTRRAKLWVGLEASDDFGIAQLQFCYKVLKGSAVAQKADLELGGTQRGPIRRRFSWDLEKVAGALTEGTLVEYWVEARDNNNVTGPSTGASEHQTVRIVSDQEKLSELLARAGEFISRVGEVTADQEHVNKTLGTVIVEKTRQVK